MTQLTEIPTNKYETDTLRIAAPMYVGISHPVAKSIIDKLRSLVTSSDASPEDAGTFIKVSHSGISQAQFDMERRLRVDLHTLRSLLFDSMYRGINLDLALRIQRELGDELVFISKSDISNATKNSVKHYEYFVSNHAQT